MTDDYRIDNDSILTESSYKKIQESIENVMLQSSGHTLLELTIDIEKFSLSNLSSILESEGIEIELFWKQNLGAYYDLKLLLDSQDLRTVIHVLEIKGYQVLSIRNEKGYQTVLKERYDHLMHYLNI